MRQLNYPFSLANTHMSLVGSASDAGPTTKFESVVVQGNYAYMSDGNGNPTLSIVNISNPAAPTFVSNTAFAGSYNIQLAGSIAYIPSSGGSTLYAVNVSNPAAPTQISALAISGAPGSLYGCVLQGSYAFLATQNKGLTVVNIANPAAMVQLYQEGGTLNKDFGVCLGQANTLYTTNFDTAGTHVIKSLKTWDITTPSAPVLKNTYSFTANVKPLQVTFRNNTCYVLDSDHNTIMIVDVTNPLAPVQLSTVQLSAIAQAGCAPTFDTSVPGKLYMYVGTGADATRGAAIDCFDITNLSSPSLVATVWSNVPTSVGGNVTLYNNLLYRANYGVPPGSAGTLDILTTLTVATPATVFAANLLDMSALAKVVDTSSFATLAIQVSNDDTTTPTNWTNLSSVTVTNGNAVFLVPSSQMSYQWARLTYSTLGSGTAVGSIKALGM